MCDSRMVTDMRKALIAIMLAAVASPAAAQPEPWAPERITAGWVVTPSIVFGGIWDSNVTVRNEGVPKTAELVGIVNPRGEIDFNGRRAKFNAGYSGLLETHRELDELTRYDQRGRLNARYEMTPRLMFQTMSQLTLSPTTDKLDIEGGVPFTRVGSRALSSVSGFTVDVTRRTAVKAFYEFQWVDFDRDLEGAPDFIFLQGGHAHSPSADLTYALSSRLKIGALYTFRHTVIDAGEEIFNTHRSLGTVEYEAGPATTLRARAGIDHATLSGTAESHTGPSYGGGVTHQVRRTTLKAHYERSFVPSFGFGGLTANQVFHAGANVPVGGGRVYWGGSFTYRRTDPFISRGLVIELDSYWVQTTVGYFVTRWLRMEGFINQTHQYSSAQGNVDRMRIGVLFVTTKPMRIQ